MRKLVILQGGVELFATRKLAIADEYFGLFERRENCRGVTADLSTVWASRVEPADWLERELPERRTRIEKLSHQFPRCDLARPTIFGENFFAHRSVVLGLQGWYHRAVGICRRDGFEPDAELLRRLCGVWFCMRDDLELRTIDNSDNIRGGESPPSVSIIVTSRDYGRYLEDCLRSCLCQTAPVLEVIYSDDGSKDVSVHIARQVQADDRSDRLKVIAYPNTGVAAARNRAVGASRGDVLIHVDGDDQLPNNFVAKHLDALAANPNAPFVYGPAQAFGELNYFWDVPAWDERFLWDRNFCNTSSAIRRWAFEAAGRWQENPTRTLWDWDLFLRASRLGTPATSPATLLYRQHNDSWSRKWWAERTVGFPTYEIARRHLARLSIVAIYSGRLPALLPKWFESLTSNVKDAQFSQPPELLILNNAPSGRATNGILSQADKQQTTFSSIRVVPHRERVGGETETERRSSVATFMAAATTRALAETTGELIWLLEDDVVPPRLGLKRIFASATESYFVRGATAGLYQNRHTGRGWVSGFYGGGEVRLLDKLPPLKERSTPLPIHLTGTGCLLFWRRLAPTVIEPFIPLRNGRCPAHDWWLCDMIRHGGREVALLPDVRCRHYQTAERWV